MIGTRQQPICHLTQGEPGAAMQTHILPRLNLTAVTPDDYFLSQQSRAQDAALSHIF